MKFFCLKTGSFLNVKMDRDAKSNVTPEPYSIRFI